MPPSSGFAPKQLHVTNLPCRFTIVGNGGVAFQQQGRALDWTPPTPGKYLVEAELKVRKEWVPWVYATPIELR
jgi:hypothetical protein